jgi:hypothetical protein
MIARVRRTVSGEYTHYKTLPSKIQSEKHTGAFPCRARGVGCASAIANGLYQQPCDRLLVKKHNCRSSNQRVAFCRNAGRVRELMIHIKNIQCSDIPYLPERIEKSAVTEHYEKKITTTGSR